MQENEKERQLSWSTPDATQKTAPETAPAQTENPAARYIGMVVVGIIAGVVIAWAWVALRSPSSSTPSTSGTTATSTTATSSNQTLSIVSPQPSGKSVSIAKAEVSSPTWIVVYEDKDGKPGNALGAALFFPERETGSVELLRATIPGRSYLIGKQTDNGDRKFSLRNDPLVTENGEVQWVTLQVR